MSFQTILDNKTLFSAVKFVLPDKEGQEVVLVVVSATFQEHKIAAGLVLADEQSPIRLSDVHYGSPELSSVLFEAGVALEKPFVDVLINGQAYAPKGRPASAVPIQIIVGDIRKELIVSGDRFWRLGPLGMSPSSPESFLTMPIVYERAFGGIDRRSADLKKHAAEVRNLAGVGFQGAPSYDPAIHTEVPNIEYPHSRQTGQSDRPEPAGLGVIARGWQPRIRFAGTYDKNWLEEQWPLLPLDFDSRHYQAAPIDQQSKTIRGGEHVGLLNLTPDGMWRFDLPTLNIPARLFYDDRQEELWLRLDTVLIEPDRRQVTMTCRVGIRTQRNRGALREIILGHVTSGWLRAHMKRKYYIDSARRNGKLPHELNYIL